MYLICQNYNSYRTPVVQTWVLLLFSFLLYPHLLNWSLIQTDSSTKKLRKINVNYEMSNKISTEQATDSMHASYTFHASSHARFWTYSCKIYYSFFVLSASSSDFFYCYGFFTWSGTWSFKHLKIIQICRSPWASVGLNQPQDVCMAAEGVWHWVHGLKLCCSAGMEPT